MHFLIICESVGGQEQGSWYCFADVTNMGLDGFRYFKGTVALERKTTKCASKMVSLKRQQMMSFFRQQRTNKVEVLVILENIF